MNGIKDTKNEAPILKNDEKMCVYLKGSHFQQNNVLTANNDHVIKENVECFFSNCLQVRSNNLKRCYFYYTKCFIRSYANY